MEAIFLRMTQPQRAQIAQQIYPALVQLAKGQHTGTYVAWFSQQTQGVVTNRNQIAAILDIPERYCLSHSIPDLTAVIVRQDTKLPGNGFWNANIQVNQKIVKGRPAWQTIQQQLAAHTWAIQCPY